MLMPNGRKEKEMRNLIEQIVSSVRDNSKEYGQYMRLAAYVVELVQEGRQIIERDMVLIKARLAGYYDSLGHDEKMIARGIFDHRKFDWSGLNLVIVRS